MKDLQLAHQQGLVITGSTKVQEFEPRAFIAILLSADVGPSTKKVFEASNSGLETFVINKTSKQLSKQFNSGPRSVVGLMSGRTTQSLLNTLREGVSLG